MEMKIEIEKSPTAPHPELRKHTLTHFDACHTNARIMYGMVWMVDMCILYERRECFAGRHAWI